ncbi:MAG TPA: TIM-barrel domain-containing protein [Ktedonobacterales bacterium]|nr:TIM-barrel domain-containing protein [Ktedonobacterales bacterium]
MSDSSASEHMPSSAPQRAWRRRTASGHFDVEATTDDILRVAYIPASAPQHQSWSLAPAAMALRAADVTINDQGDHASLRTSALHVEMTSSVDEETLELVIARQDGSAVLASAIIRLAASGRPMWSSALADGEVIYGGGERTGPLNKRGRSMTFWTTDPLPNHGEQTGAMHQSVPFLIGLVDGKAYGIYFDITDRAEADIGKTQAGILAYTPESADLVAYLLAGPTLGDVLRQYTSLTGRMSMLPRWAFGNQQSRWSYMSADEVLSVASEFRKQSIPCDVIYLDIDYMDGYRVFTWNPERFADPAGLIQTLREQHMRLVTIIDPGVKVDIDYAVYQEGASKGYFARMADGAPFQGWVWPGLSCWGDFAQPDARTWWGDQHCGLLDAGVAGIWIDMNEPAQAGIFAPPSVKISHGETLPDDVLHGTSDDPITHARFHNAYGLEMAQATFDGLRRLRPDKRPFVLTRAATAGSQRYAIVWNGDSTSSWENLRLAMPLNLGVGLSGFPMTGGDVGGFWQNTTAELLVRWTQLGALLPFCRNHSAMGTERQEPWAFGEPYTRMCREAIERRYQLLPYLLTLAHEATVNGAPMVRPLSWIDPTHAESLACDDEFVLGDGLLVAPVLDEGATSREVLLPPGEWFAWGSSVAHPGNQRLTVPVTLDSVPLYVRAGTILPLAAVAQSTDGMTEQPLTLHVYLSAKNPSATAEMWLDDDHPLAEERGTFGVWRARAAWQGDDLTVTLERISGHLAWPYPGCSIALHLPDGWTATSLDSTDTLRGDTFTVLYNVARA